MYVEDPGAANFVIPLMPELPRTGWKGCLYANGLAVPYLAARGCAATELESGLSAAELVESKDPDVVLVGTSENVDSRAFEFIDAAARAGKPSVAAVDGPANLGSRFRGRGDTALHHAPDWLFLTDPWTKEQYAKLGFPPDRLAVTGHPYYDLIRQEGDRLRKVGAERARQHFFPDAPPDRRIVVFLSEPSQGFGLEWKRRSAGYTLNGWGDSDGRTDIVMEEFLDAVSELDDRPWLVLRLHPKDSRETYAAQAERFDAISEGGQALPQLFAADLVVGLSTSLLIEAEFAGLNTLSILPQEADRDLIMTVRDGTTPCATTGEQIRAQFNALLNKEPGVRTGDAPPPGVPATQRVIEALDRLCRAD